MTNLKIERLFNRVHMFVSMFQRTDKNNITDKISANNLRDPTAGIKTLTIRKTTTLLQPQPPGRQPVALRRLTKQITGITHKYRALGTTAVTAPQSI